LKADDINLNAGSERLPNFLRALIKNSAPSVTVGAKGGAVRVIAQARLMDLVFVSLLYNVGVIMLL
jgi:hypothetical protein